MPMAKKAARGGSKAAGSRGGRPTGGARKAAPKKTARGAAGRSAAKKSAPKRTAKKAPKKTAQKAAKAAKSPARKTARKAPRAAGAAKTARGAQRTTSKPAPRKSAAGARGRKSAARRPSGGQVSRSTARAKWIETPDDLESRPGETLATRSHEVIQHWAEERNATPATRPGGDPEDPRVLRFNFPGFGGQTLQEVSWDDWFRTFDDRNLVFLFQERMKAGNQSNFFRFDNPDREDA
jgi:hypothetical protein